MRPEPRRRSGLTIAGLAIVCLTAGSLLPGSAPAAAVPDHVVTAAAPAVQYQPLPGPGSGVDDTRSSAAATPTTSGSERANSSRAAGTPTPSDVTASAARSTRKAGASSTDSQPAASKKTSSSTPASDPPAPKNTASQRESARLPQIAAAPAVHLSVPAIGVDADVQPVDSVPTGETNAFGGPVYSQIDFPVDADVRQWVRRGDPNSIAPAEAASDVKSFDRVVLYGHASDIGNHLVFQDLSRLALGDPIEVRTANGTFTYQVTLIATNDKATLDTMPELYDYPQDGRKEIALVACLPDTSSNAVVIGVLVGAAAG